MKNPGILWMLQVAAGLSLAGPMFVAGALFLRSGDVLFALFLFACGLIALFAPNYLIRRIGGPRTWIRRRLRGRRGAAEDAGAGDDGGANADGQGNGDTGSTATDPSGDRRGRSAGLLERLRNR